MESNSPQGLKRSSEFLSIKKNGKRYWPTKWVLLNFQKNQVGHLRFGVTASRKTGPAVIRNKLKRWVREYFRAYLRADQSLEVDINIIFKPMEPGFYKGIPHADFVEAMDRGMRQIRKDL